MAPSSHVSHFPLLPKNETRASLTYNVLLLTCRTRNIGIKQSFREGIMDPDFKAIRHNQRARVWAFKIVYRVWDFLQGCEDAVQEQKKSIIASAKPQVIASSHRDSTFIHENQRREVALYRGGSLTYLKEALDLSRHTSEKRLRIERITSRWGGVFSENMAL